MSKPTRDIFAMQVRTRMVSFARWWKRLPKRESPAGTTKPRSSGETASPRRSMRQNSGDTILISLIRAVAMRLWDYPSVESILSEAEGLRADSEQLTYLLFLKMADERIYAVVGVACVSAQAGRFGRQAKW